jgi:TRAP transporter TAXI family solute receptor
MRGILRTVVTVIGLALPSAAMAQSAPSANEAPLTGALSGGIASGTFGLVGEAVMEMVRRQYPGSSIIYDQSSSAGTLSRLMKNEVKTGFSFSQVEIVAAQNGMPPFRDKLSLDGVKFVARIADGMLLFAVATQDFVDKYGIKTFADIKAKKVPVRISLHRNEVVTVSGQVNELLKAYGITEADIKSWGGEVHHEATQGYMKLMKNRRLDVAFSTGWHPSKDVTELEAGTKLVLIPFDKPQVDQVIKTFGLDPAVIKAGTYDFLKEDYYTTDVSFPILARDDAPDHLVYGLAKSLYNQFDYFKSVHPVFSHYDVSMLAKSHTLPIHPSALRLYKEVGLVK